MHYKERDALCEEAYVQLISPHLLHEIIYTHKDPDNICA